MPGFRRDNSGHEATAKSASVPNSLPQDQRVDPNLVSPRILRLAGKWSGRWESNPRLKLGKLGYYHYTTPAPVLDSSRLSEDQATTTERAEQARSHERSPSCGSRPRISLTIHTPTARRAWSAGPRCLAS